MEFKHQRVATQAHFSVAQSSLSEGALATLGGIQPTVNAAASIAESVYSTTQVRPFGNDDGRLISPSNSSYQHYQMMGQTNGPASWVLHIAFSITVASLLSLGISTVVECTLQAYHLPQSPLADWKSCACLLLCCILTPLVLVRWTVVWIWNTVNRNKYKSLTAATIWSLDHTDIKWLLAGMLPLLTILAKGITYISLSIVTVTITISSA